MSIGEKSGSGTGINMAPKVDVPPVTVLGTVPGVTGQPRIGEDGWYDDWPQWAKRIAQESSERAQLQKLTWEQMLPPPIDPSPGTRSAIATAHVILVTAWHLLSQRIPFAELGPDYHARRHSPEAETRRLLRRLESLGHTVHIDPAA
jgi:hypothetical protein